MPSIKMVIRIFVRACPNEFKFFCIWWQLKLYHFWSLYFLKLLLLRRFLFRFLFFVFFLIYCQFQKICCCLFQRKGLLPSSFLHKGFVSILSWVFFFRLCFSCLSSCLTLAISFFFWVKYLRRMRESDKLLQCSTGRYWIRSFSKMQNSNAKTVYVVHNSICYI